MMEWILFDSRFVDNPLLHDDTPFLNPPVPCGHSFVAFHCGPFHRHLCTNDMIDVRSAIMLNKTQN